MKQRIKILKGDIKITMNKIGLLKKVVLLGVSVGVGSAVGNVIKGSTPETVGAIRKACIWFGSFIISSMVVEQAEKYTEEKIDSAVKQIEEITGVIKEETQEEENESEEGA
jgi:hypothetical protein